MRLFLLYLATALLTKGDWLYAGGSLCRSVFYRVLWRGPAGGISKWRDWWVSLSAAIKLDRANSVTSRTRSVLGLCDGTMQERGYTQPPLVPFAVARAPPVLLLAMGLKVVRVHTFSNCGFFLLAR